MSRSRVSTTVDGELLDRARRYREGVRDADLFDEALALLVEQERRSEIDAAIRAGYAAHPVDEPDEWGVLPEFVDRMRQSTSRSGDAWE